MFAVVLSMGTFVVGYFVGAYRQKLLNVKEKVENVVREEFRQV